MIRILIIVMLLRNLMLEIVNLQKEVLTCLQIIFVLESVLLILTLI